MNTVYSSFLVFSSKVESTNFLRHDLIFPRIFSVQWSLHVRLEENCVTTDF